MKVCIHSSASHLIVQDKENNESRKIHRNNRKNFFKSGFLLAVNSADTLFYFLISRLQNLPPICLSKNYLNHIKEKHRSKSLGNALYFASTLSLVCTGFSNAWPCNLFPIFQGKHYFCHHPEANRALSFFAFFACFIRQ